MINGRPSSFISYSGAEVLCPLLSIFATNSTADSETPSTLFYTMQGENNSPLRCIKAAVLYGHCLYPPIYPPMLIVYLPKLHGQCSRA
jgi:hypothetical protein